MAEKEDFIRLFMPIRKDLLAYVLSMGVRYADAEDVLQNCALVLFQKIESFEKGTNFKAWAYKTTKYEVWNTLRKAGKTPPLALNEETYAAIDEMMMEESNEPEMRIGPLEKCLSLLGKEQRKMILLRYAERFNVGAVARQLGKTVETTYKSLFRLREALRKCVENQERVILEAEHGS